MNNTVTQRMIEAVNQKEDLAAILNELFQNQRTCNELIGPAVGAVIMLYRVARDGGANVTQADPAMDEFLSGSHARMSFELSKNLNANPELAGRQISSMLMALNTARSTGSTFFIPATAAKAIPVSVISMPTRTTTTEVQRNQQNVIVGSIQTECDK